MSTLYRCDTCGKLLRHCAPHSREIAPPVVLRGVPEFHAEHTWCSAECAMVALRKLVAKHGGAIVVGPEPKIAKALETMLNEPVTTA